MNNCIGNTNGSNIQSRSNIIFNDCENEFIQPTVLNSENNYFNFTDVNFSEQYDILDEANNVLFTLNSQWDLNVLISLYNANSIPNSFTTTTDSRILCSDMDTNSIVLRGSGGIITLTPIVLNGSNFSNYYRIPTCDNIRDLICNVTCGQTIDIGINSTINLFLPTPDPSYTRIVQVFDISSQNQQLVVGTDYDLFLISPLLTRIRNNTGAIQQWRINHTYNRCDDGCSVISSDQLGSSLICTLNTPDCLQNGADLEGSGDFETNNGTISSNDGIVYRIDNFFINGVEQLTTPFSYSVVNSGVGATSLPNPHEAIILSSFGQEYLGNFALVFTELFQSLGLNGTWKSILNGYEANVGTKDNFSIIFPTTANSWSINMTRHDGNEYTFNRNGLVTNNTTGYNSTDEGYTFCPVPEQFDLSPTSRADCLYQTWDETQFSPGNLPTSWTIRAFYINGELQTTTPYVYNITSVGDLTFNNPGDSFFNNNSVMLNEFFTSLGLESEWSASTTNSSQFRLISPTVDFLLQIERNDGDVYNFRQNGFMNNPNPGNLFDSSDPLYNYHGNCLINN